MNWQLFWVTFASIFMAELGDKTQIGVVGFSSQTKSPMTIFLAASAALVAATFVGVCAGTLLAKYINPKYLKIFGGLLFIGIGIWVLFDRD